MEDVPAWMVGDAATTMLTKTVRQIPPTDQAVARLQALLNQHSSNLASASNKGSYSVQAQDHDTVNGVVIGLLSSFGSAVLVAFIFIVVYFFRYTTGGRILLDRIGRPGEYDDEQAYAREEAEALEEMDDLQRSEYLRAKGMIDSLCGSSVTMAFTCRCV